MYATRLFYIKLSILLILKVPIYKFQEIIEIAKTYLPGLSLQE